VVVRGSLALGSLVEISSDCNLKRDLKFPERLEVRQESNKKQRDDLSQNCNVTGLMNSVNRADNGGWRTDKESQMTRLQRIING